MSLRIWSVLGPHGFFQAMPHFTWVTTSCMAVEYGAPRREIQEVYGALSQITEIRKVETRKSLIF